MYTLSPEERIGSGASASAYLAKSGTSEPLLSAARIAWTRPSRRLGRTSKPEQRLCQRTGHVEALLVLAGNSSYRVDQYACRCICQYNEIMQKVSYPTSHPASILHTRSRCCCRCCGTSNTAVGTMTLKIIANMRWLASNATSDSRSLRRIKKDAVNAMLILHVTASPGILAVMILRSWPLLPLTPDHLSEPLKESLTLRVTAACTQSSYVVVANPCTSTIRGETRNATT